MPSLLREAPRLVEVRMCGHGGFFFLGALPLLFLLFVPLLFVKVAFMRRMAWAHGYRHGRYGHHRGRCDRGHRRDREPRERLGEDWKRKDDDDDDLIIV